MSAALLSFSTSTCRFAAPITPSSKRARSGRHASVCASYRPGFEGFDAEAVFRSTAQHFARFQRQQQSSAGRRRASGKTNAASSNSKITDWDEHGEFSKFVEHMEQTYAGDMYNFFSTQYSASQTDQTDIPAEVAESANAYRYLLHLPGVRKSEIKVSISTKRVVRISGERKRQPDGQWKQRWEAGVRRGPFKMDFQLPKDADVNKMSGKTDNGVWVLTIKKKVPQEDDPESATVPIY